MGSRFVSVEAAIGLGSNLESVPGGRRATIESAIDAIGTSDGVTLLARSTLLETEPVGGPEQGPFLNGALLLDTDLEPTALLERLHAVERAHGRSRPDAVRWGPRTLDLDLLLMGDLVRTDIAPIIPHPRLHERCFVLEPLAQIAPRMRHPVLGRTVQELLAEVPASRTT